ncbi:HRDC domain-containing protein [Myceligenerans salitolerans]|uniref:Ribonuclease D n=1 Tax=Myceligenerans salitolerans TaxID=1230528 RepID=A0ABS3ICB5_9MICO|nr:ribonuclease D [Myceligenerans salitolerans]MBO0610638.1 ribonuclease D [Myceligenerans salitolerans]
MNEPPAHRADDGVVVTPLTEPAGGLPPVTTRPEELEKVVDAFARGTGPVAADAERASGYRYGQATYLVQLKRAGAGIALVDPVALPDLSALADAIGDAEYVLHAASQDLPGLNEHGLVPARVFDTELAARLLGFERVGLAAVVAETLGLGLAKEHSAVDWSTRPLPEDWLRYAALDVEVLVEVRDVLEERLADAGKADWAAQEFEAVRTAPPPAPRVDPWRRTSGMHVLRNPRQVAVVRALWEARDATARARDISPGRVLPDRAIVAAARAMPRTAGQLVALPEFAGKGTRRRAGYWQRAIDDARALPDGQLPTVRGPRTDGPPAPRLWADRDPAAARRLKGARELVAAFAERHSVPVENLLQPDALRRLCWKPPEPTDPDSVAEFLRDRRAREWQIGLLATPLAETLAGIR